MTQAKVGIFFLVQGHLIIDAAPLANGELYGDGLTLVVILITGWRLTLQVHLSTYLKAMLMTITHVGE